MTFDALERLADRILGGEVVFFIGAGFSLDSERNTAQRLILRLLVRFEALVECLECEDMHQGLQDTFKLQTVREAFGSSACVRRALKDARPGVHPRVQDHLERSVLTKENLDKLGQEYYPINDWMCGALSQLAHRLNSHKNQKTVIQAISRRENALLRAAGSLLSQPDEVRLPRIGLDVLELPPDLCGKALFLDTMGFDNREIIHGTPFAETLEQVRLSYDGRLRPRHHVLARFAREGFCPLLLTTNFDLLLEGAYRLAGFMQRGKEDSLMPPSRYRHFGRIAGAAQFFSQGSGHRTALITKIHGCVEVYREERRTCEGWSRYLRAMVFTYREIQNWREDTWSRDLLRTLVRTRTLAFCGYSGMDPALHDTFRSVYEEMAQRGDRPATPPREPKSCDKEAPAFFFGSVDRTQFYGLEILRASSRSRGSDNPPLTRHPNYPRFHYTQDSHFPHLDELFVWLFHQVFRRCQQEALDQDLRNVASGLLGYPCPEAERAEIIRRFQEIVCQENKIAGSWPEPNVLDGINAAMAEARSALHRISGWTYHFHTALLREFSIGEVVLRNQGPGLPAAELRRGNWYTPALERPEWTAWAAVVEIALRQMIAAWRGDPGRWPEDTPWVAPLAFQHPAIVFSRGESSVKESFAPVCLSLRVTGFERQAYRPRVPGAYRQVLAWPLLPNAMPWPRDAGTGVPPASEIWACACGTLSDAERAAMANKYLGGSP